jgi:hypothetical protein
MCGASRLARFASFKAKRKPTRKPTIAMAENYQQDGHSFPDISLNLALSE